MNEAPRKYSALYGQIALHLRRRFTRSILVLLAVLSVTLTGAYGQLTTADILGTVTDATGAVIPNANVTLTNLGTQEKRSATSNSSGDYSFTLLQPGHYSITIQTSGFKAFSTPDLAVEAGDRARNDAHLQLGSSGDTVTVEAQTPLLQSESATVSSTVSEKAVQDLPLNGRNFVQLVQIVPGANEGPGNGLTSGGRPDDRRITSGFSVNGQDDTLNNYVIDGIDDNERVIGTIGVKPNVEGIQEITVQTNSYAPEAGRTAGGVVNLVTRAGTNKFHGSAYEFFRNDKFDARNVFQTTGSKPELRQNQYGGSIGGPIFRDRTFFYGDYEGFRQISGVTYQSTVPTIDEYDDINSLNGGSPQALLSASNGTIQNGVPLPIDPIALAYLQLFPAPTNGNLTNNYVVSPKKTQYSNLFDVRIDHQFNANNLFFGRYTYNKVDTNTPQALGTQDGLQISGGRYIFAGPATDAAQQFAFSYTHIFNQNLVVDLKAAFTRINNLSLPLNYGTNPDTKLGFGPNMNFNALSSFLTPISFGPFADIGDGAYVPLQDIDNTYQYLATVSYTKGNHNFKFGAAFLRRQARNIQSAFAAGQYNFNLPSDNAGTQLQTQNNQLASSLVGAFAGEGRNYDIFPPDYRSYEPGFFAQDNWKLSPKLTVIYGVRYDLFTPFTEAHGHISDFDFDQALGSSPATVGSALKIANVNGVDGHAGVETDHSNLAPRVGFSYSVDPTTVVRGGYGLSFFPGNYTSNADLKNAPFVSVYNPNCQSSLAVEIENYYSAQPGNSPITGQNPDCATIAGATTAFDQGLPLPAAQSITSPALSFVAENPHFKSALIQQFNLQVEKQFGSNVLTVGYVGNSGQHLPETINDINSPSPFDPNPGSPLFGTGARPLATNLPNLGGVGWLQSEGVSNYNALQTSFQRRFTKGLAFDANYTWAKALSDITGFSEEGQQGWSNADPRHINTIDYGIAENDIENRFALSLNYQLQYGKNFTGIKKQALAGWEFNTITVWQSGKPFSIVNGGANNDSTTETTDVTTNGVTTATTYTNSFSNRATPRNNGGPDRPDQIANAHLSHRTLSEYFNTAAFVPQPVGTVGTAQRNSVFGPHFRHIDVSIFKDFPVTERLNLQFRAEAFDLTNTPSYIITSGSGSATLGNSAFGSIQNYDTNYVPRELQFALKLQF